MGMERDIAVVGMACRLPMADCPDAAWSLVSEGRHAIAEAPPERWATKMRVAEQKGARTQPFPKVGGYLDDIAGFDARFFGITAREARLMDPQQRLLLETGWQAIEAAGLDPAALKGSRTGVFVGISTSDYMQRQILDNDLISVDAYSGLGGAQSIAANRISYIFDFNGPSIAVDTACSSSLVALHLARKSLAAGECDYALVGGVNIIASPLATISFSKARMLSPDGRCKSFDKSADGYVRSEGAVSLLLTCADVAMRNGHKVEAHVCGSAVNQDGATMSITTPNGAAQAQVLRDALADANLAPHEIDMIEAHGTGTAVGDEIELGALGEVFAHRKSSQPLVVGACKPNFGHLEAASGLVGALKAIRQLQTGSIPDLPFLADPLELPENGAIRLAAGAVRLGSNSGKLRAGLSSFGFGGTNAHIILEAPNAPVATAPRGTEVDAPGLRVLPVTSHAAGTLRETAADYARLISDTPDLDLDALCRSADDIRGRQPHRKAVIFADRDDALMGLTALAETTAPTAEVALPPPGKLAFCFTGQGAQSLGMCRSLMADDPVFAEVMTRCDAIAKREGGLDLLAVINGDGDAAQARLDDTTSAQPALFAVGLALAKSWLARGVAPDYVTGHSLGEITAACLAGVMDEETAMRLVLARGRLMASAPGDGAMAVLAGDPEALTEVIANLDGSGLDVAGRNTPRSVTISGPRDALDKLCDGLGETGVKPTRLQVSHAFHSTLMDPVLDDFAKTLESVTFAVPDIPVVSNLTGKVMDGSAPMDADYWVAHLRGCVDFQTGVETLLDQGVTTIVEIGPRPVLMPWLRALVQPAQGAAALGCLAKGRDDLFGLLSGLSGVWARGHDVDWSTDRRPTSEKLALPPYRFAREAHWFVANNAEASNLGVDAQGGAIVSRDLTTEGLADYLEEHRVGGRAVVPGAVYIDMLSEAADRLSGAGQTVEISDCRLPKALTLGDARGRHLVVRAESRGDDGWVLVVVAVDKTSGKEKLVAHALARLSDRAAGAPLFDVTKMSAGQVLEQGPFYAELEDHGLVYGPRFQGVTQATGWPGCAEARFAGDKDGMPGCGRLDPARFDAALHPIALCLRELDAESAAGLWVPVGFDRLVAFADMPRSGKAQVALIDGPQMPDMKSFDVSVRTEDDEEAVFVAGLRIRRIDSRPGAALPTGPLFAPGWQPLDDVSPGGDTKSWATDVLAGDEALRLRLGSESPADDEPGPLIWIIDEGALGEGVAEVDVVLGRLRDLATGAQPLPPRLLVAFLERADAQAVPAAEAIRAAVRVFRNETTGCVVSNLTLSADLPDNTLRSGLAQALGVGAESDLRLGDEGLSVLRLTPQAPRSQAWTPAPETGASQVLVPGAKGGLSGLSTASCAPLEPGPGEVLVSVEAAGLNFRDILKTMRLYPNRPGLPLWLGDECAGKVLAVGDGVEEFKPGDPVLAVAPRAFASEVIAPVSAVVHAPRGMDAEDAATLPIAYSTAWMALVELAGISSSDSVLVHAGAGGVGLAAIAIAKSKGARVFATAGSAEKHAYLASLGVEAIGSSRDPSFADTIRQATDGEGVDIILNSLAGVEMIAASLDLLRPFGRFIDIGKRDIVENSALGMRALHKSVSFHTLDMELLFAEAPERAGRVLSDIVRAVEDGRLAPLPKTVFDMSDANSAFQYMSGARNIGKIVIRADASWRNAQPTGSAHRGRATALVTGAFGDIGLDLVEAVAKTGVTSFILIGRSAPSAAALVRIEAWRAAGIAIETVQADVADSVAVQAVFDRADADGRDIRHVFHATGALADCLIADLTSEQVRAAWSAKVTGAENLDRACAGGEVETFACLSSISTFLGSPGQVAYAAANAAMDAVCRRRRQAGLAGQSISLGPWEIGLSTKNDSTIERLERLGLRSFSRDDGVSVLKKALTMEQVVPVAVRFAHSWPGAPLPPISNLPICADLFETYKGGSGAARHRSGIIADLAAHEEDTRPAFFAAYLSERLASVTGQSPEQLPVNQPLKALGFDSLSGLEFGMMVEEETGASVPMDAIGDDTSLADLAAILLREIDLEAEHAAPLPEPDTSDAPASKTAPTGFPPAVMVAPDVQRPEGTPADYTENIRPDFARLLPILKLDADYHRASGMTLWGTIDGAEREVVDFVGGYGSNLLGHNHPSIISAVTDTVESQRPLQVQGSARVWAGKLATELSAALAEETGDSYYTALANTGAEAVEAALKHALMEYSDRLDGVGIALDSLSESALSDIAPAVLAVEGSYHGKTLSALSIGHFKPWPQGRAGFRVIPVPRDDPEFIAKVIEAESMVIDGRKVSRIAAAFVEPVQGEGGIHELPKPVLVALRDRATKAGFPLVFDEIQCGFYRCGSLSAATRHEVTADYYLFGKSLGGGIAKISALLVRRDRYQDGFGLLQSSTFAEDDLSARAALTALQIARAHDLGAQAEARGQALKARLSDLLQTYSDILAEVRGTGLMIGLQLADLTDTPTGAISDAARQGFLGQVVASHLLVRHGVRVATTLSSPDTFRLQPSAFMTDQDLDRLIEALESVCQALRKGDGAYLVSHLLDRRDWLEAPCDFSGVPLSEEHPAPPGEPDARVGFILHVSDAEAILRWDASWERLSPDLREALVARFAPVMRPMPVRVERLTSATGSTVDIHFWLILATAQTIEQSMRRGDTQWINDQVSQVIEDAADAGCRMLGLGGFVSIATRNGQRVLSPRLGVTTGNALTVSSGLAGLDAAIATHLRDAPLKVAVLGAAGNIGRTWARALAQRFGGLTLVGRPGTLGRLGDISDEICLDAKAAGQPAPTLTVADDLSALASCNVIVAATNTSEPIVFQNHLGQGPTVLFDLSVPPAIAPDVAQGRSDVLVLSGGVTSVPKGNRTDLSYFGLPEGHVFACMAETALLGLEGRKEHFSIGEISLEQVNEIAAMADTHGFDLSGTRQLDDPTLEDLGQVT